MENPFEIIIEKLIAIERRLINVESKIIHQPESLGVAEIMTLRQLADYSSMSKSLIYKLTSSREIPHSKRGKRLYFSKMEIDEWLLKQKIKTVDEIQNDVDNYLSKKKC
jgi:excisionase family DNA binding protein